MEQSLVQRLPDEAIGPGRPIQGRETKRRYQVMLEPRVAEKLRNLADGNLSAGIAKALERSAPEHERSAPERRI
jgi:hypothetical protein